MSIYLWWNLPKIIVSIQVLECHRMRLYMGDLIDRRESWEEIGDRALLGLEIVKQTIASG